MQLSLSASQARKKKIFWDIFFHLHKNQLPSSSSCQRCYLVIALFKQAHCRSTPWSFSSKAIELKLTYAGFSPGSHFKIPFYISLIFSRVLSCSFDFSLMFSCFISFPLEACCAAEHIGVLSPNCKAELRRSLSYFLTQHASNVLQRSWDLTMLL